MTSRTTADLEAIRAATGATQAAFAERMGLGLRAYQDLAAGRSAVRAIHIQAACYAAMEIAVESGDPMKAPPEVRKLALKLVTLITG